MAKETYATARLVMKALMVLGWAVCALSLVMGLQLIDGFWLEGAVLSVAGVLGGLVTVALAQIGLAHMDTADAVSAILAHLAGSEATSEPSGARPEVARVAKKGGGSRSLAEVYKDRSIDRVGDGFEVDGQSFSTLAGARAYIDQT